MNKKLKTKYTETTMGNSLTQDASKFFDTIEDRLILDWKSWDDETRGARSGTYNDYLRDTFLDLAEENNILVKPCEGSLYPFDKDYCSDYSPKRGSRYLHFKDKQQLKAYMKQLHPKESYFIATLGKFISKKE